LLVGKLEGTLKEVSAFLVIHRSKKLLLGLAVTVSRMISILRM
jgi:hypothetical protein